jgi:RNA recognition motif-containing protein
MEGEFKLFVSNVPYNCSDEEFKNFMLTLNGVSNARLVKKPNSTVNKGFGFVSFTDQEKMKTTKEEEVIFNGRKLKFTDYSNQQKFYKIHVMNVPVSMSEQTLFNYFTRFGKVDNVKKDFNMTTKEYKESAMVVFTNYEDFNNVLTTREFEFDNDVKFTVTKRRFPTRKTYKNFPRRRMVTETNPQ